MSEKAHEILTVCLCRAVIHKEYGVVYRAVPFRITASHSHRACVIRPTLQPGLGVWCKRSVTEILWHIELF